MDVLTTVAIAATLMSAVAFALYKLWNKDEDTFAKAVAANKITLLDDVAPKKGAGSDKKEKEKQAKKKEEKKKNKAAASASDSSKDVSPVAAPTAASASASPTAAPAKEETSPKSKPASPPAPAAALKKETAKPKPEEPKKKEAIVAAEPVAVKKEDAAPLQAAAPAPEQKKPAQSNGDKKANKKASPNKQVEEISNEEEFVEAKTKKTKKTEKKDAAPAPAAAAESTAPRHLSLKDLDTNKVVARLSTIDEIEVEYIDYLNKFFHETSATAARVALDGARAARQTEEAARALATAKNEKTKLEGELENNRRTVHELANKAANAASAEAELKSKLAALAPEMDKLRRDLESSKKAAAAVVIPVVPDNKEELEKAKAAEKSALARVADLEDQLKNTKESAAKERKQLEQSVLQQKTREDAAVGQEVLLAESRQNAKAISQRLTELEQVKESLEARLAESTKHADELKEQAKQRDATHAADTLGFKKMIEDLNKEVLHFETIKKEQAEMVAKLAAKEAELTKKCAALEEAEKQITVIKQGSASSSTAADAQIAALTKRVSELEQALAEEQKRAAEVVIPVAPEPKAADVEEIVELKKSAYLNAAPPAADQSAELEALKKENARLQEKNESLRSDKHALCDQLTAMEKRVVAASASASNGVPAPSTSSAPAAAAEEKAAGGKKGKKGAAAAAKEQPAVAAAGAEKKDEEERVRAERRLVVSHIGKLIGGGAATPALDDSADTKSYEKWLQTVVASVKDAQQKSEQAAKKSQKKEAAPVPVQSAAADDEEKEHLRAQNESLREAIDAMMAELNTIEQHKSEAARANGKA